MAHTWYVTLDGREQGPLVPAQLKSLVTQGRITPETMIRRDDLAKPVRAGSVKGLLPQTPSGFTEIPPESPTSKPVSSVPVPSPKAAQPVAAAPAAPADADEASVDPAALRATPGQRVIASLIDGAVLILLMGALVIGAVISFASAEASRAATSQELWAGAVSKLDSKTEHLPPFAGFPDWEREHRPELESAARTAKDAIAALEAGAADPPPADVAQRKYELGNALIAAENGQKELDWLLKQHGRISQESEGAMAIGAIIGISLIGLLCLIGWFAVPIAEAWWGTTVGKRMLGLRVLRIGGGRVGLGRSLLRHLLRGIPFGQIRAFIANDHLALHDLLSKTEVTRREAPALSRRSVSRRPVRSARASRG